MLLHAGALTQRCFQHRDSCTPGASGCRCIYTETILAKRTFRPRHVYAQVPLHRDAFIVTKTCFFTDACAYRCFYAEMLFRAAAFTRLCFYTGILLHGAAFALRHAGTSTHRCLNTTLLLHMCFTQAVLWHRVSFTQRKLLHKYSYTEMLDAYTHKCIYTQAFFTQIFRRYFYKEVFCTDTFTQRCFYTRAFRLELF